MTSAPKIAAVIVAAGQSQRLGAQVPKQYMPLAGETILRRSVRKFLQHPAISAVQVVIAEGQENLCAESVGDLSLPAPVTGGDTRAQSVWAGLQSLRAQKFDYVLVHDAARPLVDADIIDRVCAALAQNQNCGVVPAVPVVDTLKRENNGALQTESRANLFQVQTPQGFEYGALCRAYEKLTAADFKTVTDDAQVFELSGGRVMKVDGAQDNFKITHAEDFTRAQNMLAGRTVVSMGYDVHRFASSGDHVMLGGVKIPHRCGIEAHSDGDVVLHALTDAILGCAGDGDIGIHFPDTDARWRGASSSQFVAFAVERLRARGGFVQHADITIMAQEPKLMPYRAAIIQSLSQLLSLPATSIGLKATTLEGLGVLGNGEGIAAQVVITVIKSTPPLEGGAASIASRGGVK